MPALRVCAGRSRRNNKKGSSAALDRTNDREVVAMSNNLGPSRPKTRPCQLLLALVATALGMTGCASMTQDVDAYYRQMAYNYKEALEKAKVDELSLTSQVNVLASTGQTRQYMRTERELERVKKWEAKCEKQAGRFEKAAEWTEARFHLKRPQTIPDGPPSMQKTEDQAVLQASGEKSP
jgi:hypothetical protein